MPSNVDLATKTGTPTGLIWSIPPDNTNGATGTQALRYRASRIAMERLQHRDRPPDTLDRVANDWISGRIGDRLYVVDHIGRPSDERAASQRFFVYRQLAVMIARSFALAGSGGFWIPHTRALDNYFDGEISFDELAYVLNGFLLGEEPYVSPWDDLASSA